MSSLIKNSRISPVFGSLFDDFMSKDLFVFADRNFSALGTTLPSVNLKETEKSYEIEIAAPGMKKDDFNIQLDNHLLTVSSEKKQEKEEKDKKGNYTRREFNYSSFRRSFTLPAEVVEQDKIEATYTNGILQIVVPKKTAGAAKPAKNIKVK